MQISQCTRNGHHIAVVDAHYPIVTDVATALDLIGELWSGVGCNRVVVPMSAFSPRFFDLSTQLAGDILQKCVNYKVKIAIVGDFTQNASESLQAFIRECNRGDAIFFLPTTEDALDRLSKA